MDLSFQFNEDFFYDQARWLAELSHAEVKTEVMTLQDGFEWKVVYCFKLYLITLRFKITEDTLLEWNHFRVCPRRHGIGRKFAEIFLEELKLTDIKRVILQPKNQEVAEFWRKMGFKPFIAKAKPSETDDNDTENWFLDLS